MARPKFQIDYDLVRRLAGIMCTQQEIAACLGCSVDTLERDERFCGIYKEARETGKMSLRRMQWKLAEKSYAMAIFLGKQYLGQKDVVENQIANNGILEDLKEALNNAKKD